MTKKLLLLFALVLSTLKASAHDIEIQNAQGVTIYYNIVSDKELAVTFKGEKPSSYVGEYAGIVVIPENVFYDGKIYDVTSIGKDAFDGCTSLTSVTIGNKVTSIGKDAFEDCSGLIHVVIGSNVTYIGGEAFKATGITTIDIPNSVTGIGNSAFQDCANLTSFSFPNNITSIEEGILTDCINLKIVTIPKNVTVIDEQLLRNCHSLTEVYCYAENVPITDIKAFEKSNAGGAILYVPATSIDAYKMTDPWSQFGTIKPLGGIGPDILRGDANGDGKVDMDDATFVTNVILETEDATEAADINNDGVVNMPDAVFIVNKILNNKFPDEDFELEKAGVRFGFYEDVPGYSVKINKLKVSGLRVSEFGSVDTTIKESNSNLTYDKPDGSFTNVIFKDANENPQMVVEVDYTLTSDKGTGETFTGKAINNISLQGITQWEPNKNYTFIFKVIPTYLYILNDYDYRNPTFYLENVIVEGQDGSTR